MKRKTNLFYTDGPDSKFLTFSNYAESITGNFLSVDTKVFPSRFLCMSISNLNKSSKKKFIQFLVSYYENKLAILRDNTKYIEDNICPFAYLIEGLSKIVFKDEVTGENFIRINDMTNELEFNETPDISNLNLLTSEITEQDYNGIYTDIICSIDLDNIKKCIINLNEEENNTIESIIDDSESIYGWENINEIPGYESIMPIYDNDNNKAYFVNSNIESMQVFDLDDSIESIKLNVIIPLYEITDINPKSNNTILGYDDYVEETKSYIIYVNDDNKYRRNVPLGIWINADKDNDSFIEIDKDLTTGMSPVWSLLISSQFKPFPYSTKYEIEGYKSEKGAAFATFSQVLLRLNKVMDNFEKTNARITNLESRLEELQTFINNIGTTKSIDNLASRMNSLENDIHTEVNEFKEEVKGLIENIKWKYQ